MTVSLKGFEYIARTFIPRSGLTVTCYAANDNAPTSPGTLIATTTTNVNGMWTFTGLADGLYDVKVDIPAESAVKWYKGNSKIAILLNGSAVTGPGVGSENTVLRTTDGTNAAFGKVLGADITPQTIKGASVGAGMQIGYQTIYGGQAGGNANIAPGSIQNGDLQTQTIRGGVDGASGRIVPHTLNGDDIALTRTILGLAAGTSSHIAAQTIYGGAGGVNGNIVPASINNGDLVAKTIRGGVDGGGGRIADGTISTSDLQALACSRVIASNLFDTGTLGTYAGYTWLNGGAQVGAPDWSGGYVVVLMWGYIQSNASLGNVTWVGIGDNVNSGGTGTSMSASMLAQGQPSCAVPYSLLYVAGPSSGTHNYYGVGYCPTAGFRVVGQMIAVEFKR